MERYRNVLIKGGWIYVQREQGIGWDPLEEHYKGHKPYLSLVNGGEDPSSVVSFFEKYGAIVPPDQQWSSQDTLAFRLADFHRERLLFELVARLAAGLRDRSPIRKPFRGALGKAYRQLGDDLTQWQPIVRGIQWALHAPDPNVPGDHQEETRPGTQYTVNLWKLLKEHIEKKATERQLRVGAQIYVASAIKEKLAGLSPSFEYDTKGRARLYTECHDLLQSFYWMLADDLAGRRGPAACAICGQFFFTSKVNVVYCNKPECRQKGRRKKYWEKKKVAINRRRRREYQERRKRKLRLGGRLRDVVTF